MSNTISNAAHDDHPPTTGRADLIRLTGTLVEAYLSHNPVPGAEIPGLIRQVFSTLNEVRQAAEAPPPQPAVPVKRSVTDDYLVCLEDGKKLKMLKRYLRTTYGLSPDEYRAKWGLPADYPMVAPSYARQRADFARRIGLGKAGKGSSDQG
ncbi:MucR family transcriptional regulator [Roseospirillum parvum]|uniref:Predicted transcriptional regulator n=1 Tax=Roseospirillum parvum TaxID=83401 RepID=A0A1G7Y687_9PROT|nr:MucR family transcriptional regulator [Roseospirillum parvum]SDG91500.1 Predicted transcriptional regulator [Roseospirillum parvum]